MDKNKFAVPNCKPGRATCELRKEVIQLKEMLQAQNKQIKKLMCLQCCCRDKDKQDDEEPESTVNVTNPHLRDLDPDILYHLGLDTKTHNLKEMFGDVRFVCAGGTPKRMENFAYYIMKEIGYKLHPGALLKNISEGPNRYAMFKVGPVLSVSHGMGNPSISILLNELIKLMYYAKCQDPIFFRLGTCGGIGVEPGTVCITAEALDGQLRNFHELLVQGKPLNRPTALNKELADELKALAEEDAEEYETVIGKTMCVDDFYEGQSRLDGAFCDYNEDQKLKYLDSLTNSGVINIEMESATFAALTNQANIRSAVICAAIVNRLKGDQITTPPEELHEWEQRPQKLVARYMRKVLLECNDEEEETSCCKR